MTDEELLKLIEKDGRTWISLVQWATARRFLIDDALRTQGASERASDFLRGRASLCTILLDFHKKLNEEPSHE
jgi:hypothetical protein